MASEINFKDLFALTRLLWPANKFCILICADAPVIASEINFKDLIALTRLFWPAQINFVIIALARLFGQSLINFIDFNTLTHLKFSKFSIIIVFNAFLHVSEKIKFWKFFGIMN